jgi:radical SAM-linked protein
VSVSPHIPKPHTPFAWAEQISTAELNRRLGVLREAARGKPVTLKYRDAETSLLEGAFTRGDRRLGLAVEEAWRRGCRFDAWSEHLKFGTWLEVFRDLGMDPERQLIERSTELDQPWEVVQSPVTRRFLVQEKRRADQSMATEDCRLEDVCFSCGVVECPQRPWVKQPHAALDLVKARATVPAPGYGRPRARVRNGGAPLPTLRGATPSGIHSATRFRIVFEKGVGMRFTSHLDLMRTWERSLRRSGLPLAFSQGHHPHLKMSFGPPLPLGFRSRAEVFDLELTRPPAVDLAERLNAVLPESLRVLDFRPILFKTPSLMSQLEGATYRVRFPRPFLDEAGLPPERLPGTLTPRIVELLARDHVLVRRASEGHTREFDARPSIVSLGLAADEAVLEACIRFTPRAQVRPDELVALLLPGCDPRTVDVERTVLWAETGGRRLDPLALLEATSWRVPSHGADRIAL